MKNVGVFSIFSLPLAGSKLKPYALFVDEFLVTGDQESLLNDIRRWVSEDDFNEIEHLFETGILRGGVVAPGNLARLPDRFRESYLNQHEVLSELLERFSSRHPAEKRNQELLDEIFARKAANQDASALIEKQHVLAQVTAKHMVYMTQVFEEAARLVALDQRLFHNTNACAWKT